VQAALHLRKLSSIHTTRIRIRSSHIHFRRIHNRIIASTSFLSIPPKQRRKRNWFSCITLTLTIFLLSNHHLVLACSRPYLSYINAINQCMNGTHTCNTNIIDASISSEGQTGAEASRERLTRRDHSEGMTPAPLQSIHMIRVFRLSARRI
jgi:hypothetical protein